jgi:hypothetical protein
MYAAVMANGCGLDSWECNSQCTVAVADTLAGPFAVVGEAVVASAFCHNPTAHLAPDGTIVIFHIGNGLPHDGVPPMHCHSGNGTTDPSISPNQVCKKPGGDHNNSSHENPTTHYRHHHRDDACFAAGQFAPGDRVEPGNAIPNIAWTNASTPEGPFASLRDPKTSGSWDANNAALHIFSNGTVLLVA